MFKWIEWKLGKRGDGNSGVRDFIRIVIVDRGVIWCFKYRYRYFWMCWKRVERGFEFCNERGL